MQYFDFQKRWLLLCIMTIPQPMTLVQTAEPFDDWDWLYEIKHNGFCILRAWSSYVEGALIHRWSILGAFWPRCQLMSIRRAAILCR
jgi:hypothetical protein